MAYDPQNTRIIFHVNKYKPGDDVCYIPTRATLLGARDLC